MRMFELISVRPTARAMVAFYKVLKGRAWHMARRRSLECPILGDRFARSQLTEILRHLLDRLLLVRAEGL